MEELQATLPGQRAIRQAAIPRARPPFTLEAVALVAGVLLWEVVARLASFHFLPPFTQVVAAGVVLFRSGVIGANLLVSLSALIAGFALAVAVGVPLGAAMGRVPLLEAAFGPFVNALLAAPSLAFVPILFILFGVGGTTRVAVVFLYSVVIIIVNTATAARTVDPTLLEMGRAFGATPGQIYRRIIFPDALPLTLAGLRLGLGRAVKGMINGEMFIAFVGLGGLLRAYGSAFDAASVLAIVLVVVAIAQVLLALPQLADRRLTWWTG